MRVLGRGRESSGRESSPPHDFSYSVRLPNLTSCMMNRARQSRRKGASLMPPRACLRTLLKIRLKSRGYAVVLVRNEII